MFFLVFKIICSIVCIGVIYVPRVSAAPTQDTTTRTDLRSHHKCSRAHSKFVREYFARTLWPIYQSYKVPVPEKCPFSPLYDIYHYHENNKTKVDIFKWKCEICGKYFTSEAYLDLHFDRRHNDSLQLGAQSVCLASFCRIFRCDFLLSTPDPTPKKCYESTMMNLNKKCKSHLELCIPKVGVPFNIQNKLANELRENLCAYLTCSRVTELPSFMIKGPNFFFVFVAVVFVGLCIIAYGLINHTNLIFDENEEPDPINFEVNNNVNRPKLKANIMNSNKNKNSSSSRLENNNEIHHQGYRYLDRLNTELRHRNNKTFFSTNYK